jgi:hypothetical protein
VNFNSKDLIPVLDKDKKFLSNTTPAKARKMLKTGRASVFQKSPFIIFMNESIGETMTIKKQTSNSYIQNFTTYFKEEKEVYVQNLGSTNISLELKGREETIYISIARTRRPMNLTMYAPFDRIKQSVDFRKLVNRNPPLLRLMSEEEYYDYYAKIAQENGTGVEQEMREGHEVHDILMGKRRPSTDELKKETIEAIEAKEELLLNPKEPLPEVIGLCVRADESMGDEKITAKAFKEELETIKDKLGAEDWDFIIAKGVYKTVQEYARKQLDSLSTK